MKKWFTRLGVAMAIFAGTTTAMAQETLVVDGSKSYLWELTKGSEYKLPGTDGTWYCQPGFFTHVNGDVWKFNSNGDADFAYAIKLNEELKYIEVEFLNATNGEGIDNAPLATFGTNKAIFVNGNENIGFPSYATNKINWGGGKDVPVPQIADGVYHLELVGGQQINASSINFKFFMGKNWGGDMGTSVLWLEDNEYIRMGGQEGESGDNGNLYGKGGDVGDLDTLVVTINLNKMHGDLGTITVEKHGYTPVAFPQLNGANLSKFGNTYFADLALTKGQELTFANLDAIDLNWEDLYVNSGFATKGANGKLTFNAVDGNYCVAVVPALNLIRIYPGTYNAPATYQDGKAIWMVGNAQFGMPSYAQMPSNWGESNGWSPNINHCIPVAQVEPNIYKIELTVGKELGSNVNMKFFCGVAYAGGEFRGEDLEMGPNDYLRINQPEYTIGYDEQGNEKLEYGDDDGNIFNGTAPLGKGDKIILTVDLNDFAFHQFDPISFDVICKRGKISVEYIASEAPKPSFAGVIMASSGDWYYADVQLTQGSNYDLKNMTEVSADDLYTDVCFASYNGNGNYTFNAISGNYCVMVNPVTKYLKIFPGTHAAPAGIADGGLWIIGEGFGRPNVNNNAAGWNTGLEKDFAVAQTQPGIYQMDLTCDVEMWDSWCNYKFFGQPDWGIEFKPGTDYSITSDNEWLNVGESDGNIQFKEGASFTKGEPIYIVIDFTKGLNAGVMTVSKSPIMAVEGIITDFNNASNAVYTISGVRVNNAAQHGIYIVNGKKVVK